MIIVCSLKDMPLVAADNAPTHIVSLIQPAAMPQTPAGLSPTQHLKIAIDDITEPCDGMILPTQAHVGEFIEFVARWEGKGPIVLHCHAGVSRSMAAALVLLCLRNPGEELAAARWLRRRAAHANPNRLMVSLADTLLSRDGHLLHALDSMAPAHSALDGGPVTHVPVRLDR